MRSTLNHRREVINLSDILTLGLAKQLSQLLLTQSEGFDVPGGDSGGHDVLGNALWTVSAFPLFRLTSQFVMSNLRLGVNSSQFVTTFCLLHPMRSQFATA